MGNPETTTLNIPSLLAFTALTILAIRYFFFSPTSSTSSSTAQRAPRIPPDRIDTLSSMFPQVSRRDIEWDLRRNGGNVQATTERVLRDNRLPAAPASFRASTPPPAPQPGAGQGAGRQQSKGPTHENLIQRYKLSARVADRDGEVEDDTLQTGEKQRQKGKWSSSKQERAEILKRRRDEMVLAARRKMEMKEKKEGKARAT